MEEYLKTLLEQIRCKSARTMIEREIRNHMEEQIAVNQAEGMTREDAVRAAVLDMGDPVETGISLDHIHRPQAAWGMMIVMAAISLLTILIHVMIGMKSGEVGALSAGDYILRTALSVGCGYLCMCIVYHLDYSFMAKYAKIISVVFLSFLFLQIFFFGLEINGARAWINVPWSEAVSITWLMLLYIPIYAARLYQDHGLGAVGIVKAIIRMLIPFWLAFRIPNVSLAGLLLLMMSVLLSLAVWKGWYQVNKKRFLAGYWSVLVILPLLILGIGMKRQLFAAYQSARIQAFFTGKMGEYDYITKLLREYTAGTHLFGNSGNEIVGYLPDYYSAYILTFLSSCYGIAFAVAVCGLVVFVAVKAFYISLKQKNQLGMMMGCGCGLVFLVSLLMNICENFGLLPPAWTFLPFFSYGGTGIVVSYILMGIVLSVYRYKAVLPAHTDRSRKGRRLKIEVSFK